MFDRQIVTAILVAAFLIGAALLAARYCSAPEQISPDSGNLVVVCLFPWPWYYLFGARPVYVINIYVAAGIPLVIFLIAWLWSLIQKDR